MKTEDIQIPFFSEEQVPKFSTSEVEAVLNEIDAKKSNVNGDFPVKLLKTFSKYLAVPIKDLLNCSIKKGIWPEIFKMEIVTHVPKQYPPKNVEQLRNISVLLKLEKN